MERDSKILEKMISNTNVDTLYKREYYIFNCKVTAFYDPNKHVAIAYIKFINEATPFTTKFTFQTVKSRRNWETVLQTGCSKLIIELSEEERLEYVMKGGRLH